LELIDFVYKNGKNVSLLLQQQQGESERTRANFSADKFIHQSFGAKLI
jgi:hypothetical protein